MKTKLLMIAFLTFSVLSCKQNKTEIGLKYHDSIVEIQTEALDAFEDVLDAATSEVEVLVLKHTHALKTTENAILLTNQLATIENGENLKQKSLDMLQGMNKILSEEITKIIEIREELNKNYNDKLVDDLNDIILKSHNQIDLLIINFNNAQYEFSNHYNFELVEDDD
jgi:hypothetical protein